MVKNENEVSNKDVGDERLERRNSAKQIAKLAKGQTRVETRLNGIDTRLAKLEDIPIALAVLTETVAKLHDTCPHQVEIAKGMNNIKKIDDLTEEVKALKEVQHEDRLLSTKNLAKLALVVAAAGMAGSNIDIGALFPIFG